MMDSRPKIMVVDDNPGMRLTLEGVIENEGFDVVGAADGYQAIRLARDAFYPLIFMDMVMPGINGVDTYREIKKIRPGSVVAMMTGFSVATLVTDALEEGAYGVIHKPFDMAQIIETVRAVLKTAAVLVMDDQAADRVTLRAILEERGFQANAARGAAEAVQSVDPRTAIDAVASAVSVDRPDLPRPVGATPDGTVTLLFTDIEGSTAITERLGDQRWLGLLHIHDTIIRKQLAAHGGFEVKSQGDGFMAAFQSAGRALQCAIAIQQSLATYNNQHHEEPIRVRSGLHTGEAIKEADDFFGKAVILAARIAAQAQGGQILVSGLLKELTESSGQFRFDGGREIELKGLSGSHRVFELEWQSEV